MKDETRQYVRAYIVGVITVIIAVLAVILPIWRETRDTLTATGTVRIENALGVPIIIEDMRSGRQLARIKPLSDCSFQFGLAAYENGRSMTTFQIGGSGGRCVEIESKTFIDHCAEVRDHGVDLRATAGKEARNVTKTIEWRDSDDK